MRALFLALAVFGLVPINAYAQQSGSSSSASGCRPPLAPELIGKAEDLDYILTDTAGLNVVLVHVLGQTTLSDRLCRPDPEQGALSVVVNYGAGSNEPPAAVARDMIFGFHARSHPERRPADFPPITVTSIDVNSAAGSEAVSLDTTVNGFAVFRYALVFAFPDGAKGLLNASGPAAQLETLRPSLRRIGAGLRARRNVQQMEQDLAEAFDGATNRFVTDEHLSQAVELCSTTNASMTQLQERALSFGWNDSGQTQQGGVPWRSFSAVRNAPGLLSVGVPQMSSGFRCVVAAMDQVRQRFDAELQRQGLSPEQFFVINQGHIRPAASGIVLGRGDRLVRLSRTQNDGRVFYTFSFLQPS